LVITIHVGKKIQVRNGCMPSQFSISNPCPFGKNKGVGFGSFYLDVPGSGNVVFCNQTHLMYNGVEHVLIVEQLITDAFPSHGVKPT
jgi:hypothetical protein